jgi:hypothetical protein
MHTVVETHAFSRAASSAGMSEAEVDDLIVYLAANPTAGDEMAGTGGCRKLRLAGRGKGKSGGYRIVTFYSGIHIPVFLLTVFSKGEKANLSKGEHSALAEVTRQLVASYRRKVVTVGERR